MMLGAEHWKTLRQPNHRSALHGPRTTVVAVRTKTLPRLGAEEAEAEPAMEKGDDHTV